MRDENETREMLGDLSSWLAASPKGGVVCAVVTPMEDERQQVSIDLGMVDMPVPYMVAVVDSCLQSAAEALGGCTCPVHHEQTRRLAAARSALNNDGFFAAAEAVVKAKYEGGDWDDMNEAIAALADSIGFGRH
jgi:stress response protein SCP2